MDPPVKPEEEREGQRKQAPTHSVTPDVIRGPGATRVP